jgi:tRNA(Ser,Leu) C12 N-acetylase TAN1
MAVVIEMQSLMICEVSLTEQEIKDLLDDQDPIADIIMLELSIEIEQAEMTDHAHHCRGRPAAPKR